MDGSWVRERLSLFTVDATVSRVTIGPLWPTNKGVAAFRFAVAGTLTLAGWPRKVASMTHRILAAQAPHATRELIGRPLWLIVMLVGLWLGVLLLAMQAYPQSTGPEVPNPGNAHMVPAQTEDAR